jgi:endonuclease YncB( thermonuclease family)
LRRGAIIALTIPLLIALVAVEAGGLELDAYCRVTKVIDGDTFKCVILESPSGLVRVGLEYRVRLADINAPELRPVPEEGAVEALRALEDLVGGRVVALDIDDIKAFDRYGRVVAVVMAPHNETHLVNVNRLLVERGLARLWEHENEWRLLETPLYVPSPGEEGGQVDSGDFAEPQEPLSMPRELIRAMLPPLVVVIAVALVLSRILRKR